MYLFPYEKVERGSRVVLYGMSGVGRAYVAQIMVNRYCDIIFAVDRNYKRLSHRDVPVMAPEEIKKADYDYVVISATSKQVPGIMHALQKLGVPQKKIVYACDIVDTYLWGGIGLS